MRHTNSKFLIVFGLSAALVSGCACQVKCRVARTPVSSCTCQDQQPGGLLNKKRVGSSYVSIAGSDERMCRQCLAAANGGQPTAIAPTAIAPTAHYPTAHSTVESNAAAGFDDPKTTNRVSVVDGSNPNITIQNYQIVDRQSDSIRGTTDSYLAAVDSELSGSDSMLSTERSSRTYYHGDTNRSGRVIVSEKQYATSLKTKIKTAELNLETGVQVELDEMAEFEIKTLESQGQDSSIKIGTNGELNETAEYELNTLESPVENSNIDLSPPSSDPTQDRKMPSPAPVPFSKSAPVSAPETQNLFVTIEMVNENDDNQNDDSEIVVKETAIKETTVTEAVATEAVTTEASKRASLESSVRLATKSIEAVLSVPRYLNSIKFPQMKIDKKMESAGKRAEFQPLAQTSSLQTPTQVTSNPLVLRADPTARGDFLTAITRRAHDRELEQRLNTSSTELSSWIIEPVNFRPLPRDSSRYPSVASQTDDHSELPHAMTAIPTRLSNTISQGHTNRPINPPMTATTAQRIVAENTSSSTEQPLPLQVSMTKNNWSTLPKTDAVTRAQLTMQAQKRQRRTELQLQQQNEYSRQRQQPRQQQRYPQPNRLNQQSNGAAANSATLTFDSDNYLEPNSNGYGDQKLTGNIQPESVSSNRLRLRATPNQSNLYHPPLVNIDIHSNNAGQIVENQIPSANTERLELLHQQLQYGNQRNSNQSMQNEIQSDDSIRRLTVRPSESDEGTITIDR